MLINVKMLISSDLHSSKNNTRQELSLNIQKTIFKLPFGGMGLL